MRMAKKADVPFVGFTFSSPEYLMPQGLPSLLDDSRAATTTGRSTTFLGLDLNSSVGMTCLKPWSNPTSYCSQHAIRSFIDKSKHRPEDAFVTPSMVPGDLCGLPSQDIGPRVAAVLCFLKYLSFPSGQCCLRSSFPVIPSHRLATITPEHKLVN